MKAFTSPVLKLPGDFPEGQTDGVCHCPLSQIQYLIGISQNDELINVKTGKCLRCSGTRLNKIGHLLVGKTVIINQKEVKK